MRRAIVAVLLGTLPLIGCKTGPKPKSHPLPETRHMGFVPTSMAGDGIPEVGNYDYRTCQQVDDEYFEALRRVYFDDLSLLAKYPELRPHLGMKRHNGNEVPCPGGDCYLRVYATAVSSKVTLTDKSEIRCANPRSPTGFGWCKLYPQAKSADGWRALSEAPQQTGMRGSVIVADEIVIKGTVRTGPWSLVLVAKKVTFEQGGRIVTRFDSSRPDDPPPAPPPAREGGWLDFQVEDRTVANGGAGGRGFTPPFASGTVVISADQVVGAGTIDTRGMPGGPGAAGGDGWDCRAADPVGRGRCLLVEFFRAFGKSVDPNRGVGGDGGKGGDGAPAGAAFVLAGSLAGGVQVLSPTGGAAGAAGPGGQGGQSYARNSDNPDCKVDEILADFTEAVSANEDPDARDALVEEMGAAALDNYVQECLREGRGRKRDGAAGAAGAASSATAPKIIRTSGVRTPGYIAYDLAPRGAAMYLFEAEYAHKGGRLDGVEDPIAHAKALYEDVLSAYCGGEDPPPDADPIGYGAGKFVSADAARARAWRARCAATRVHRDYAEAGLDFYGFPPDYYSFVRPEQVRAVRDTMRGGFETLRRDWFSLMTETGAARRVAGALGNQQDAFTLEMERRRRAVELAKSRLEQAADRVALLTAAVNDAFAHARNLKGKLRPGVGYCADPTATCPVNEAASYLRISPASSDAPTFSSTADITCSCGQAPSDDCGVNVDAQLAMALDCLKPPKCDAWCQFKKVFDVIVAGAKLAGAIYGSVDGVLDVVDGMSDYFKDAESDWDTVVAVAKFSKDLVGEIKFSDISKEADALSKGIDALGEIDNSSLYGKVAEVAQTALDIEAALQSNLTDMYAMRLRVQGASDVNNKVNALAHLETVIDIYQRMQAHMHEVPFLQRDLVLSSGEVRVAELEHELAVADLEQAELTLAEVRARNRPLVDAAQVATVRDAVCRRARAASEPLLLLDFTWQRSVDFLSLATPAPYDFTLDLLRLPDDANDGRPVAWGDAYPPVGARYQDYAGFLQAEADTVTQDFVTNTLSSWQSGSANTVCESLFRLDVQATQTSCDGGTVTWQPRPATGPGGLDVFAVPFSDNRPDPACCSSNPGCDDVAQCDDHKPSATTFCGGSPSCDATSSYAQAKIQHFDWLVTEGPDPAVARALYAERFMNDLLSDGLAVLELKPNWSQELAVDEAQATLHRVTDLDISLVIDTANLPTDSVGTAMRLGTVRVAHAPTAVFPTAPGGADLRYVELDPGGVERLCRVVVEVASRTSAAPPDPALCDAVGALRFSTEETEHASGLRTSDDARLASFSDNRLFGTSLRGGWTVDIRDALAAAYALDRLRPGGATSCTPTPADRPCAPGTIRVVSGGPTACCSNTCAGAEDDPSTPADESAGNTACYDLKRALKGVELKIFWRARP